MTSEAAVDARAPNCCRFSLGPGMCFATARLGLPLLSPTVRQRKENKLQYVSSALYYDVFCILRQIVAEKVECYVFFK